MNHPSPQECEENLVSRARQGDQEALRRLFEACEPRLAALVRSRLSAERQNSEEAADLVQETLVKALASIDGFEWRGEGSFLRWLGGIAEHLILQAAGQRKRRPVLRLTPLKEEELAGPQPSPSRALRREERLSRLEEALAGLSDSHREVIRLARFEGLSTREIARRLKRGEGAVRSLLLRALQELKRAFGDTESLSLPDRGNKTRGSKHAP